MKRRDFPADLLKAWLEEVAVSSRRGLSYHALTVESLAQELSEAWHGFLDEELTVAEVVALTGWSESTVYRKRDAGELVDVGEKGSPRFTRGSVPLRLIPVQPVERPADGPVPELVRSVLPALRKRQS